MNKRKKNHRKDFFEVIAQSIADSAGRGWAFTLAFFFVVVWLVTGPLFQYSNTWQLIVNTVTSAITFLMVFLIQHAQNRQTEILNLKLDEVIKAIKAADNQSIPLDDLSDKELKAIENKFRKIKNKKTGQ